MPEVELRGETMTPGRLALLTALWVLFWVLGGTALILLRDVFATVIG